MIGGVIIGGTVFKVIVGLYLKKKHLLLFYRPLSKDCLFVKKKRLLILNIAEHFLSTKQIEHTMMQQNTTEKLNNLHSGRQETVRNAVKIYLL